MSPVGYIQALTFHHRNAGNGGIHLELDFKSKELNSEILSLQIMEEKICEGPCQTTIVDKIPPCPLKSSAIGCKAFKFFPDVHLQDLVIIWIYGGPSSGKTTQCKHICAKYGLTRVHVGELLLKEIAAGSIRAKSLQNAMDRRELVPNDVVIQLLKKEITAKAKSTKGFVIDGYPREKRQGLLFEVNIAEPTAIIYLDVNRETLTDRHVISNSISRKRWPTEQRKDNCVAGKYQSNLFLFLQNHKCIFDQYPHKIYRINAENRSHKEIFDEIKKTLDREITRLREKTELRKANKAKWKALKPKTSLKQSPLYLVKSNNM